MKIVHINTNNVDGIQDMVRPDVTGLLAESGRVDEPQRNVCYLLESHELRELMSENRREVALKECSMEIQAKELQSYL